MLRALALNDFQARYLPRVIADFQMGGISTVASVSPSGENLEACGRGAAFERAADRRRVFSALPAADFFQIRAIRN